MKVGTIVAALLLICGAALAGDDLEAFVAAHYPERLISEDDADLEQSRFWDYRAIDLDGDPSSEEVVVVYSNWSGGLLCMLRLADVEGEPVCADEVFGGNRGELEVMDLDSDGRPEFAVKLLSPRDGSGFLSLFRWRDGWEELTEDGEPLRDPLFADFDGDGDLDALPGIEFGAEAGFIHFWQDGRLERGKSEFLETIFAFLRKERSTNMTHELSLGDRERACRIRLAFDDRITGALVSLNGATIFGPHHFLPGVRALLSDPMMLRDPAELVIEVQGKPGGEMYVIVETP